MKFFSESKCRHYQSIYCIDGRTFVDSSYDSIVGYCHNDIHKGCLTKNLLKSHECLQKHCRYLEKNPNSKYWDAISQLHKEKRRLKQLKHLSRKAKAEEKQHLEDVMQHIKDISKKQLDDFEITGVSLLPDGYKISYVSTEAIDDSCDFEEFRQQIQDELSTPVTLLHIKNLAGHYATIQEYHSLKIK